MGNSLQDIGVYVESLTLLWTCFVSLFFLLFFLNAFHFVCKLIAEAALALNILVTNHEAMFT